MIKPTASSAIAVAGIKATPAGRARMTTRDMNAWRDLDAAERTRTAMRMAAPKIVARSVEATMHKLFELGIDLYKITSGIGTAPLPPVSSDDLVAIGRTNDSILYGGRVTLWVDLNDDEIAELGPKTPSNSSADYGKPFGEIFRESGGDFYKLDPMLFSAAEIRFISNLSGRQRSFGRLDEHIIEQSFS